MRHAGCTPRTITRRGDHWRAFPPSVGFTGLGRDWAILALIRHPGGQAPPPAARITSSWLRCSIGARRIAAAEPARSVWMARFPWADGCGVTHLDEPTDTLSAIPGRQRWAVSSLSDGTGPQDPQCGIYPVVPWTFIGSADVGVPAKIDDRNQERWLGGTAQRSLPISLRTLLKIGADQLHQTRRPRTRPSRLYPSMKRTHRSDAFTAYWRSSIPGTRSTHFASMRSATITRTSARTGRNTRSGSRELM